MLNLISVFKFVSLSIVIFAVCLIGVFFWNGLFSEIVAQTGTEPANRLTNDSSPLNTVARYLEAAREDRSVDLQTLIQEVPDLYWEYELSHLDKPNPVYGQGRQNQSVGRGSWTPINKSIYKELSNTIPAMVKDYEISMKQYVSTKTVDDMARVRVLCQSDLNEGLGSTVDFFLVRNETGNWKIFHINYFARLDERFPAE